LDNPADQLQLWKKIKENSLSVRDTETTTATITKKHKKNKRSKFTQNVELRDVEDKLTTALGTKVKVFGTRDKGKIEVNYYSREDLERIIEHLGKSA
jgi:ParB family chromosome partitioning protein